MYKELIEKLRCCVEQIRCGDCRYVKDCDGDRMMMSEAADAIEDLTAQLDQATEYLKNNADAIEELNDRNVGKWIPVTEENNWEV